MPENGDQRGAGGLCRGSAFTDVYGAKRTGLYNILTEPINPKEGNSDRSETVSGAHCTVLLWA